MALVIPAIDLRGGRCVRLHQGSYDDETVYFDDPVKMAKLWRVQNARVLHVVDLDAARGDSNNNREVIARMCDALDIPIQLGGGIRSMEQLEKVFDMGVYRVVIGTAAVRNPDFVSEAIARYSCSRIVVGIDARDGEARVEGWTEGSGVDATELALEMEDRGVRRIVYTDISRDGTLEGLNVEAYRRLGRHLSNMKITASGGVSDHSDLLHLESLASYGIDSVIIGKALYENKFPCQQFWCWHDKESVDLNRFSTAQLRNELEAQDSC